MKFRAGEVFAYQGLARRDLASGRLAKENTVQAILYLRPNVFTRRAVKNVTKGEPLCEKGYESRCDPLSPEVSLLTEEIDFCRKIEDGVVCVRACVRACVRVVIGVRYLVGRYQGIYIVPLSVISNHFDNYYRGTFLKFFNWNLVIRLRNDFESSGNFEAFVYESEEWEYRDYKSKLIFVQI